MTSPSVARNELYAAFAALQGDLVHDGGPRISTMRNYRFAIVPYDPAEEFKVREHVQTLSTELVSSGWVVRSISLQKLVLDRVRAMGPDIVQRIIDMERRTAASSPERGLHYLATRLAPHIEGPEGIAADCAARIEHFIADDPDKQDRMVVLIGRAGALYPFFRSSALLKHLDGTTRNIPVVLLYPGKRYGTTGLKFMDMLKPDRDYRPRIYGPEAGPNPTPNPRTPC